MRTNAMKKPPKHQERLPLQPSKNRPGKRDASLDGCVVSEACAEEIERRAAVAGMDVRDMINRLVTIATLVTPDHMEMWDDWADANLPKWGRR